jgi:hypothetical protein
LFYWSSTENGNYGLLNLAWGQDFNSGLQSSISFKGNTGYVRAVRAF